MRSKQTRTATCARKHATNLSVNTPTNVLVNTSAYAAVPIVGALTLREAAIYLSISEVTLYRLMERGLIRSNRMTRLHLFPVSELDRALREGMA
jgi:excisionase family DNA binding protein